MAQRGRKSAASLAVVPLDRARPPAPPDELTPAQASEWMAVVKRLPAGWFPRESHGLLIQFCRHIDAARRVAQLIKQIETENFDYDIWRGMLETQRKESAVIKSLATSLRISQQARQDPKTAGRQAADAGDGGPKPWEI